VTTQACPECRAGKHRNCDGTAWDVEADALVDCPCNHPLLGVAYPEDHQEPNGKD
jgi:hypothetical protein